jgi:hypothetical protein
MKKIFIHILLLSFILTFGIWAGEASAQTGTPPDIRVAVAQEKLSFTSEEPLKIILTLENQGGDEVMPAEFKHQDFHLMLVFKSPGGKKVIADQLLNIPREDPAPPFLREIAGVRVQVEPVEIVENGWVREITIPDAHAFYRLNESGVWTFFAHITEKARTYPQVDLTSGGVQYSAIASSDWSGSFLSNTGKFTLAVIDNQGPVLSGVIADPNPAPINTDITLSATVDDSGSGGSAILSAEYSIDGGSYSPMDARDGAFDSEREDVTATIPGFTEAGVHTICLRGWDSYQNTADSGECIFLTVYDPDGGFVTGGGWIQSPQGAYVADSSLTGKATFGFVSKYKKGAHIPTGTTEFEFQVADLYFYSDLYDWLVVAGARAKYKGTGTINGSGTYKFMLTAIDADANDSDRFHTDRFRIKIWWEEQVSNETIEHIVYDNGLQADESDDNATTAIGGGSIVVHAKHRKKK